MEASRACEQILAHDGRNADARFFLGLSFAFLGRPDSAVREFSQVLSEHPRHVPSLINAGVALAQLGRHEDAVASLRRALALDSRPALPHCVLGNSLCALGQYERALASHRAALARDPNLADAANGAGIALRHLERTVEAIDSFRQALESRPQFAEALSNLGTAQLQTGDVSGAIASLRSSLAIRPHDVPTLRELGNAFREAHQYADSIQVLNEAVALSPDDADTHNDLGSALLAGSHCQEAVGAFEQALSLDSAFAEAATNLGQALLQLEQFEQSAAAFGRASSLDPRLAPAALGLGRAQLALNDAAGAARAFERALALDPQLFEARLLLARAYEASRQSALALATLKAAIESKPDAADVHFQIALMYHKMGDPGSAAAHYERTIGIDPAHLDARRKLGHALEAQGKLVEAVGSFEAVLDLSPDDLAALAGLLSCSVRTCEWNGVERSLARLRSLPGGIDSVHPFVLLSVSGDRAELLGSSRAQAAAAQRSAKPSPISAYGHERIRVAYVSPDFRDHPVAILLAALIESHDRTRFETVGISLGAPDESATGQRIVAAFDRFLDVSGLTDDEVAALMRDLEIDIAVDLAGYTKGNRSGIFASRAAPVQVNYLGFPGTLGAQYIDYIIADPVIAPAAHAADYCEKLVHLPDTYQVNDRRYAVTDDVPSRIELGLPEDGFVFCCFNNSFKLARSTFDIWMRLLRQVDRSVLWLAGSRPEVVRNLRSEAASSGVDPQRLVFAPRVARRADHLARYRRADLFLDTLPFNAHATATDALWCDLPVITCMGETFAGRVAASILHAVGLEELVCRDLAAYEALALQVATTPDLLAEIRSKLRSNKRTRPLFDTDRFRQHIEAAYRTMWERFESGALPMGFSVTAVSD